MTFGILGSVFGFLGVALGAFGAHALKARLIPEDMAIFETAVHYQMVHSLALLAVALLVGRGESGPSTLAGWAFVTGIVLFSGSLFVLVFTGERWLGAVTPVGGVSFLLGWLALGWSFFRG